MTKEQLDLLQKLRSLLGNNMPDQKSTNDQLKTLMTVANQLGLYDAADTVKQLIK